MMGTISAAKNGDNVLVLLHHWQECYGFSTRVVSKLQIMSDDEATNEL
jgi:hypothetical protein